jgi:preprotein translocase subunit YajC
MNILYFKEIIYFINFLKYLLSTFFLFLAFYFCILKDILKQDKIIKKNYLKLKIGTKITFDNNFTGIIISLKNNSIIIKKENGKFVEIYKQQVTNVHN